MIAARDLRLWSPRCRCGRAGPTARVTQVSMIRTKSAMMSPARETLTTASDGSLARILPSNLVRLTSAHVSVVSLGRGIHCYSHDGFGRRDTKNVGFTSDHRVERSGKAQGKHCLHDVLLSGGHQGRVRGRRTKFTSGVNDSTRIIIDRGQFLSKPCARIAEKTDPSFSDKELMGRGTECPPANGMYRTYSKAV